SARPMRRPFPAARAAGANAANTPAPIIEPSPITTASAVPSLRASRLGASAVGASLLGGSAARLTAAPLARGEPWGEAGPVADVERRLQPGDLGHRPLEALLAEAGVLLVLELLAQLAIGGASHHAAEGGKEDRVLAGGVGPVHADEAAQEARQLGSRAPYPG